MISKEVVKELIKDEEKVRESMRLTITFYNASTVEYPSDSLINFEEKGEFLIVESLSSRVMWAMDGDDVEIKEHRTDVYNKKHIVSYSAVTVLNPDDLNYVL